MKRHRKIHFTFVPYLLPLTASSLMSLGLSLYGFAHWRTQGARELTLCSLVSALWAGANALEIAGGDLQTKLFWANIQYLAFSFVPLTCLAMVLRFSGKDRFLTIKKSLPFFIIPILTSVLVWFDPTLGLVRHSFSLDTHGSFPVIAKAYGPWYWIHCVYSYGVMFSAIIVLIATLREKGSYYRRQTCVFLLGFGLVFAANIFYVFRLGSIKRFDLTPIVLAIAALIFWLGIFRCRLYKILPIARNTVFERIANGILVIDKDWLLVDCNEAAQRIFGLDGMACAGKNLRDILPDLCATIDANKPFSDGSFLTFQNELRIVKGGDENFYSLSASHLLDSRYEDALVLVVTDINDFRNAHNQVLKQREELAAAAERDKLAGELHDNLGQILSFAIMQSDAALREMELENHTLASSYLTRLKKILNTSREDLRDFVHGMREAKYVDISLSSLIEKEADIFSLCCGIPVSIKISQAMRTFPFSVFQKTNLVRAVKEALNNIATHAKASNVVISLEAGSDGIRLCIEDDGVGLDADGKNQPDGAGLDIMEERALALGGKRVVESKSGEGTRVTLVFPQSVENSTYSRGGAPAG
ncbi:MAG TPA: histidine kinase N-terminal 7TM domain-containing protein [Rectinemataceae bacterium]|nr:histidine kinase N-terminal 7TM domain-containing protein [Rectinemataceae bacterium]